jgi:hypothetical protein
MQAPARSTRAITDRLEIARYLLLLVLGGAHLFGNFLFMWLVLEHKVV